MQSGVLAAGLVAALFILGCGNGDDAPNDSAAGFAQSEADSESRQPQGPAGALPQDAREGARLTKTAFVKRANAICRRSTMDVLRAVSADIQAIQEAPESDRAAIEVKTLREKVAPRVRRQLEELRALGPAPGGAKQVEAMLSAAEGVLDSMENDPEALLVANGRFSGVVFQPAANHVRSYGLRWCPYGLR